MWRERGFFSLNAKKKEKLDYSSSSIIYIREGKISSENDQSAELNLARLRDNSVRYDDTFFRALDTLRMYIHFFRHSRFDVNYKRGFVCSVADSLFRFDFGQLG